MLPRPDNYGFCEQALIKLLKFCRSEGWSGYDPYDGLNSFLARPLPREQRLARTILTQVIKRSPVNLRPLVGIKKGLNPKGVALAARAIVLLAGHYGIGLPEHIEASEYVPGRDDRAPEGLLSDFNYLFHKLGDLRSPGFDEACWGYNFDWQSRAFYAPRATPNVVCTAYAAQAHLDWYDGTGSDYAFEMAESSCRFLLDRINRTPSDAGHCFSYTPLDVSRVHNVNLLAAELLARAYGKNRDERFREAAERAVAYTVANQRADGSWPYGEARSQAWIDSFHTGFVLVSLKRIMDYLQTERWREALTRGYAFYEARFFLADSTPKYYHDRLYPIDVHSAAQAVITFLEMSDFSADASRRADRAARWTIEKLQDPSGFFYFQKRRFYMVKTPFMRWSQAWMLYSLSLYLTRNRAS